MDTRLSAPEPSSVAAHNRMKAVRRQGSAAEMALSAALEGLGLVYTANEQPLPGLRRTADIVFRNDRLAVFVDGCFWHGCPQHGTQAKANADFWRAKIERNKQRDADTDQRLEQEGWIVVRVWEHDDPGAAAIQIKALLCGKGS